MAEVTIQDISAILDKMKLVHFTDDNHCALVLGVDHNSLIMCGLHVKIVVIQGMITVTFCPVGLRVRQTAYKYTSHLCQLINDSLVTGRFRITTEGDLLYEYSQILAQCNLAADFFDEVFAMAHFVWKTFAEGLIPTMLGFSDKPQEAFVYCLDKLRASEDNNDDIINTQDSLD